MQTQHPFSSEQTRVLQPFNNKDDPSALLKDPFELNHSDIRDIDQDDDDKLLSQLLDSDFMPLDIAFPAFLQVEEDRLTDASLITQLAGDNPDNNQDMNENPFHTQDIAHGDNIQNNMDFDAPVWLNNTSHDPLSSVLSSQAQDSIQQTGFNTPLNGAFYPDDLIDLSSEFLSDAQLIHHQDPQYGLHLLQTPPPPHPFQNQPQPQQAFFPQLHSATAVDLSFSSPSDRCTAQSHLSEASDNNPPSPPSPIPQFSTPTKTDPTTSALKHSRNCDTVDQVDQHECYPTGTRNTQLTNPPAKKSKIALNNRDFKQPGLASVSASASNKKQSRPNQNQQQPPQNSTKSKSSPQQQQQQQQISDRERFLQLEKRMNLMAQENKDLRKQLSTVVSENRALRAQNQYLSRLYQNALSSSDANSHPSTNKNNKNANNVVNKKSKNSVAKKLSNMISISAPNKKAGAVAGATSLLCVFFIFGLTFSPSMFYRQGSNFPLASVDFDPTAYYNYASLYDSRPYTPAIEDKSQKLESSNSNTRHHPTTIELYDKVNVENARVNLLKKLINSGDTESNAFTQSLRKSFHLSKVQNPSTIIINQAVSSVFSTTGCTLADWLAKNDSTTPLQISIVVPSTSLGFNTSQVGDDSYTELSCDITKIYHFVSTKDATVQELTANSIVEKAT